MAQGPTAVRAIAARQSDDIRSARRAGFFPLTPALPWGEGESCAAGSTIQNRRPSTAPGSLSPLPRGEGQGEVHSIKWASSPQPSPPQWEEREKPPPAGWWLY